MSDDEVKAGLSTKKYQVKDIQAGKILTIRCEDEEGKAYPSTKFTLIIGDKTIEGTVDENGLIKQKIPGGIDSGILTIEGEEIKLSFTEFDTINTIKGAQQRLKNLGYNPGPGDGILGPRTKEAIRGFQKDNPPLTINGEYGQETQDMLLKLYGS